MYRDLLREIEQRMKKYGDAMQPPCPAEAITDLHAKARVDLSHDIPDGYASFLMLHNGLDWNGLVVYASDTTPITGVVDRFIEGFVEANLGYRGFESMREYLIFANDGVCHYVYNIPEGRFEAILAVGLSVMESYDSFDELLAATLQVTLG